MVSIRTSTDYTHFIHKGERADVSMGKTDNDGNSPPTPKSPTSSPKSISLNLRETTPNLPGASGFLAFKWLKPSLEGAKEAKSVGNHVGYYTNLATAIESPFCILYGSGKITQIFQTVIQWMTFFPKKIPSLETILLHLTPFLRPCGIVCAFLESILEILNLDAIGKLKKGVFFTCEKIINSDLAKFTYSDQKALLQYFKNLEKNPHMLSQMAPDALTSLQKIKKLVVAILDGKKMVRQEDLLAIQAILIHVHFLCLKKAYFPEGIEEKSRSLYQEKLFCNRWLINDVETFLTNDLNGLLDQNLQVKCNTIAKSQKIFRNLQQEIIKQQITHILGLVASITCLGGFIFLSPMVTLVLSIGSTIFCYTRYTVVRGFAESATWEFKAKNLIPETLKGLWNDIANIRILQTLIATT